MARYSETVKAGYYLHEDRCFYLTGTLKGNKWIYEDWADEGWVSLTWTCINAECVEGATYSETIPELIW